MEAVAAVTGAAGGIGRAISERLVRDGFRVVLLDLQETVVQTAAEVGGDYGATVDVRSREAVRATLAEITHRLSRLDVLVNCAGTCCRKSFEDMTLEDWHRDADTNLTAAFLTSQDAVFPYMRDQRSGRIVNISSVSGMTGGIGPVHEDGSGGRSGVAYAAAKAGVINMSRWIAREVGKWNITCNAVAPGPVASSMTAGHAYALDEMPLQRWGTPEDVAGAVSFLAGPDGGFITGACLVVDGGLVRA